MSFAVGYVECIWANGRVHEQRKIENIAWRDAQKQGHLNELARRPSPSH
jgi:hypothetical protein